MTLFFSGNFYMISGTQVHKIDIQIKCLLVMKHIKVYLKTTLCSMHNFIII